MNKHSKDNNLIRKKNKHSNQNIHNIPIPQTDNKSLPKKSKKKLKKKHSSPILKKLKRILLFLILIALFIFIVYRLIAMSKWQSLAKEMVTNTNSIVVDSNGNKIATLGSERIHKNVSFADIPDNLKHAYVSIEDERFYKHKGVDIKRTGAAILSYIRHFGSSSFGGSTITQQLVKNMTGDDESSVSRKIEEWSRATELELCMSKDDVLEAYLNIIYTGPNIYGVEMGSHYYFSKSVQELTLEECAFLAGLNHSPNSYNPFQGDDKHDKIAKRSKLVLDKMLELKYISQDEFNLACSKLDEGLNFKKGDLSEFTNSSIYSYHTDAVISDAISDIAESKHISEKFATNYLYMAGLTIYSTQDSNIQKIMENEFENKKHILESKQNSGSTSQAAMVMMNHTNGYVVGCVGGLGEKNSSRGFNRATQAIRQTGSASKPLTVLVPGIDKKIFNASTIVEDTKTTFVDAKQKIYSPANNDNYLGNITLRRAVESSQNIPFVKLMEQITPSTSIKYLKNMGITSLTDEDNNLALSLGGLEKGISPLEMAGAYSCIANNGVYIEPVFYTKIIHSDNKILIEKKQKRKKVISTSVSYIIKELLTEPVNR